MTKDNKIQWHPAFCAAMELELAEDRDNLSFFRETNLSKKPLQIDLLIIAKKASTTVHNPIGHLFRKHNIVEYKSPGDSLNIDVFYKVQGYACLYKSSSDKVNGFPAADITVSIFRNEYPKKLIRQLKIDGFSIEKYAPGVYYIVNKGLFPTQLIVTSELDEEQNIWIASLKKDLEKYTYKNLVESASSFSSSYDKECYDSVLQVITQANQDKITKWKEDEIMIPALQEIFEPEIKEIKERVERESREKGLVEGREEGRMEGREEGRMEGRMEGRIQTLHELGYTITDIAEKINLSELEVASILKKISE